MAAEAGLGLLGNWLGGRAQAKASRYAADLQDQGSLRSLDFLKSQAQNSWQNDEVNRRANYDQWLAGERRVASVGRALGYGQREIPAYVPTVDPRFKNTGPQPTSMLSANYRMPGGY
jgi:hypothetical protein